MEKIYRETSETMKKSIESFKKDLATMRTGRASTTILEGIKVDYYGTLTPLNHLATISTPQPSLFVIQPWDKSILSAINKAILASDLGLTPQVSEGIIRCWWFLDKIASDLKVLDSEKIGVKGSGDPSLLQEN